MSQSNGTGVAQKPKGIKLKKYFLEIYRYFLVLPRWTNRENVRRKTELEIALVSTLPH